MTYCNECTRDEPISITCPLNGKTTCARCHDSLCPKRNAKPVVDLGKRSLVFQGRKFDLKDVLA